MGRLYRAFVEAADAPPTPRKPRDARILVSPELAPSLLSSLEAFDRLWAGEYIDHGPAGAGSWRMRRHYNDAGELMRIEIIEQIDDVAPPDHFGVCFECSLHAPPEGWSQVERRARNAELLARPFELRPGHAHPVDGSTGVKRVGWRDHMPAPAPPKVTTRRKRRGLLEQKRST